MSDATDSVASSGQKLTSDTNRRILYEALRFEINIALEKSSSRIDLEDMVKIRMAFRLMDWAVDPKKNEYRILPPKDYEKFLIENLKRVSWLKEI